MLDKTEKKNFVFHDILECKPAFRDLRFILEFISDIYFLYCDLCSCSKPAVLSKFTRTF